GAMEGKEMFVRFFSLGPTDSVFTIPALQITDSAYVAHSEDLLYRQGYEEFKKLGGSDDFFHFIHSAGELDERNNSKNIDKRRVYIDLEEERVFSTNTQYGGNTIGLKKLAFRLAIKRGAKNGWLAEHMFVMGAHGPDDRVTYFTGAFPSGCGKTSTAMIPGQSVVGDDIAYLKEIDGEVKAVNIESGIFGIIRDVNPEDDPLIYKVLNTPRELIFSNILVNNGEPYWMGMGEEIPEEGINYSGEWHEGKTDEEGNKITPSHRNARYTIQISDLENADRRADDPEGVPVDGFIYGGRDSDTSVPVAETLNWSHGVFTGACLESETTAATLGDAGVRNHNPMANLDFVSTPIGEYIQNHLEFGEKPDSPPTIFSVNYFLKNQQTGEYFNAILDKKAWLMWMEGRVNGEFEAIKTPVGYIPHHQDLQKLFQNHLNKDYTKDEYKEQFSIRVDNYLDKNKRMEEAFAGEQDVPEAFMAELDAQRQRLEKARVKYGSSVISPFELK
ncbi:MAG: phosphoenolpyruvate carboxykinase (GTP), partial [bacterium]